MAEGKHFKADIQDLKDSGAAAKSASTTVSQHVGAGHLREAALGLTASSSLASLRTLATNWETWAKSWTRTMTDYGESLEKAAKDYSDHDDRYSQDFSNIAQGTSDTGPDYMPFTAP